LRQRYTIDLTRTPIHTATIDVVARDFVEAKDLARERAAQRDFPWETEHEGLRVTKVVCHAGEVPDESH
jgi:hypothetical protein